MEWKLIPDPNTGLRLWYVYDFVGGFHCSIKELDDNRGFIGTIVDQFTGETMDKRIGSDYEVVANKCHEYINTLIAKGFITSVL